MYPIICLDNNATSPGLTSADCYTSLRLSIAKFNTKTEIALCIESVKNKRSNLKLMNS